MNPKLKLHAKALWILTKWTVMLLASLALTAAFVKVFTTYPEITENFLLGTIGVAVLAVFYMIALACALGAEEGEE